jgi:hypothetical protein
MRRFVGDKPRAIATATYHKFAKKYHIGTTGKAIPKLAQQIYNHENKRGVRSGLYFKPK